jgi:hypothetical protein
MTDITAQPTEPNAEPKFSLGAVITTAAVNEHEKYRDVAAVIRRHVRGDWGDLDDHDKAVNEAALANGERLLSSYVLPATSNQVWVITEADDGAGRQATTVLYPSEY